MKKLYFLLFAFFIFTFNSLSQVSQEKLAYELYYYVNPKHQIKKYEKILVITNADPKARKKMKKVAKKTGFNIVIANDYFPPYKKWTTEEVDSTFRVINADAVIHINRKRVQNTLSTTGMYSVNKYGLGIFSTQLKVRSDVEIEAYFIDVEHKEEYAFHCEGWVGGKVSPAMFKSLHRMFRKFPKIGVAYPSK